MVNVNVYVEFAKKLLGGNNTTAPEYDGMMLFFASMHANAPCLQFHSKLMEDMVLGGSSGS
jgi:hypothetical protein